MIESVLNDAGMFRHAVASCVSLSCWPLWLTHQLGSETFSCGTCGTPGALTKLQLKSLVGQVGPDSNSPRLHEQERETDGAYVCVIEK